MCPRHLDHELKSRKKRQVSKKRTQKLTKCQHWCFSDTWRFRHLVIFLVLSLDTCLFFLDFNPWFTSVDPLTFKNTCDFYNAKQKLPSVWDLTFFRHLAIQTFDKGFSLDTCVFFTSRFQSKCNLNTWRFRHLVHILCSFFLDTCIFFLDFQKFVWVLGTFNVLDPFNFFNVLNYASNPAKC